MRLQNNTFVSIIRGIHGRMVMVANFKTLALHHCGFKSCQGLWILSCKEAILLAHGMLVVLIRWPFVPEKMNMKHKHKIPSLLCWKDSVIIIYNYHCQVSNLFAAEFSEWTTDWLLPFLNSPLLM
jgi:hypothetical protein